MKTTLTFAAVLALAVSSLAPVAAQAAEKMTVINGAMHESITLSELQTLVDTGRAYGGLQRLLSITNESPETARAFLTQKMDYSIDSADALLNSPEGMAMVDKLAAVVQPGTSENAQQAIRAAIVNSLADGSLTPLEVFANYPAQAATVDAIKLRKSGVSYAGLGDAIAMMQSSQMMSKAKQANASLDASFADREARMQSRMQAMWGGTTTATEFSGSRRAAVAPATTTIRGLW
jgi:Alpha/beta hydrolase of unknown function (DUF1400)